MSKPIDKNKIVVFTGAGVSAESGIQTFRDAGGLWENHSVYDVATPQGWRNDPELVLDFYNARRKQLAAAEPNKAHLAIAELEKKYEVVVITQNIDDLHERAGSNNVIHLHGELRKVRSVDHPEIIYDIGYRNINLGDRCELGGQLRPHIVWFGEEVFRCDETRAHFKDAAKVLVVGTSLAVVPAANFLKRARYHAEKIIVALEIEKRPFGYSFIRARATEMVPYIADCWLQGRRAS